MFFIDSQTPSGWKQLQEESEKQGQLWGQTKLLHVLASDVLKTFKSGDTASPDKSLSFKGAGKAAMVHGNLIH